MEARMRSIGIKEKKYLQRAWGGTKCSPTHDWRYFSRDCGSRRGGAPSTETSWSRRLHSSACLVVRWFVTGVRVRWSQVRKFVVKLGSPVLCDLPIIVFQRFCFSSSTVDVIQSPCACSARVWYTKKPATGDDPWLEGVVAGPVLYGHGSRLWDCYVDGMVS